MKNVKVKGIEFEVEVDFDSDNRIENMWVNVPGSDQDLVEVLDGKVVAALEEACYRQYEGPEVCEDEGEER